MKAGQNDTITIEDFLKKHYIAPINRRYIFDSLISCEEFIAEQFLVSQREMQFAITDTYPWILSVRKKWQIFKNPKFASFLKGMD